MSQVDRRGCEITGGTPAAVELYERALTTSLGWRNGAADLLDAALREAPSLVIAHVLKAWLLLAGRDVRRIGAGRHVLATLAGLPANGRERLHVAAIRAVIDDNYEGAKRLLGDLLRRSPTDVLALQIAHSLDYLTGDSSCLQSRVQSVLPAWSSAMPGYDAVLAMHAFSLEENGEFERAEREALEALARNPDNARAHHVLAHVFEMTNRPDAGIRWMRDHKAAWATDTIVAVHVWWHVALFHLALGRLGDALALYDEHIRANPSCELSDLIDASALLWRIDMLGGAAGTRWNELADRWSARIDDAFCSFNDVHAMLAFVGARDWQRARRLERVLMRSRWLPTRHGATTRRVGLPAGRALIAFGCGNYPRAVALLTRLPASSQQLGGSHAQRDVLHLTLLRAVEHARRAARPLPIKRALTVAHA